MKFNIQPFIAGIVVFIEGIHIVFNPEVYSPILKYTWDLTGYNVPFGIAVALAGAWLMWSAFKGKHKRDE
jgi:hypothetical protein